MVTRKHKWLTGAIAAFLSVVAIVWIGLSPRDMPQDSHPSEVQPLSDMLQGGSDEQFDSVLEVKALEFPRDHGPHPTFQTEWWYFTGNLASQNNAQYGFQFTIFRRAFSRDPLNLDSDWADNQVYLAHVGITDVATQEYLVDEKSSRGALGLAGAQIKPFAVWVEDWAANGVPGQCKGCLDINLKAKTDEFTFDLHLKSAKPVVLHGEQGFSRKSDTAGIASYYYSLTRLETSGTLTKNDTTTKVSGSSWMDHEWFSTVLGSEQAGWDWFSLQLDDGRELMLFQIRPLDASTQPFKYGILVDPDGQTEKLVASTMMFTPTRQWQSLSSQISYPVRWQVEIPTIDMVLDVEARVDSQARDDSFRYWEGAVTVSGQQQGQPVTGVGYLEMTGY